MAKMKMRPGNRPRVKAECLRLLASLKLDPAERQETMEMMTSWQREGRALGIAEGITLGIAEGKEALLDFSTAADLEQWLAHQAA